MTAHDLKPCPFCGGEARIETVNHDYGVTYSVGCFGSGRCGASFTLFDHRNDAIATWNRRTLSTITPAEVGGLVAELRDEDFRHEMQHLRSSSEIDRLFQAAASLIQSQAARIAELEAGLGAIVNARALSGVRDLVAGWNGETRPDGPYAERHPSNLGATLPKTNCGAVYELDEAMQSARALLNKE